MNSTTAAQPVEKATMTVVKPLEEKKADVKTTKSKGEPAKKTPVAEKKPLSIEDIKRKTEILIRLAEKYDDLQEKQKRMENFAISHDKDTAEIVLHDAKGQVFKSNSPKAIQKFIEFCKDEFSEVIRETEKQMRTIA